MPFLSAVTSTETFKSAVLYENKGLFLGEKISYYMRLTIDGKQLKEVEFAPEMSLCCLSSAQFYTVAIFAAAKPSKNTLFRLFP